MASLPITEPAHGTTRPAGAPRGYVSRSAPRRLRSRSLALTLAAGPVALSLLAVTLVGWLLSGTGRHAVSQGLPRHGLMSLPLAARGPVSAALGQDEPSYVVLGLHARNSAQRLELAFTRTGVTVASEKTHLHLALAAYGRGSVLERVGSVSPDVHANRVFYSHPGVREWYANGPLGLGQGFDVTRAPAKGRGPLTLSLALSGDVRASLEHSDVLLKGPGDSLRYGDLQVSDARGHRLHSWLELGPGRLFIKVDDRGAVYPLRIDPLVGQAEPSAPSSDACDEYKSSYESTAEREDEFGYAVAVSGNTIAVGMPGCSVGFNLGQGAVYVFTMPASGWANATQTAELTASDGWYGDKLGFAVAVSGNTIVAGAPDHAVNGNYEEGAAYVFTMPASGWANATQTAELTVPKGFVHQRFGSAVAISGNTIVAGAPFDAIDDGKRDETHTYQGAAYVFTMPVSGWANATPTAELTAAGGGEGGGLGGAVAISGETIVASAPDHKVDGDKNQGMVYVYTMPASGWRNATQTAELTSSDHTIDNELGSAVAISGNTIVAAPHRGAVYVFTKPDAGWVNATQTAVLKAPAHGGHTDFVETVAISGNTIVAGVLVRVGGGAFVFTMPASGWHNATPDAELTASGGGRDDGLGGWVVAISGDTVVAGELYLSLRLDGHEGQGAAYVYTMPAAAHWANATQTAELTAALAPLPPAPTITALRQSTSTWREGSRLAQLSWKKKPPVGTTFSFSLNEQAEVEFNFIRRVTGRKVKGRCVAQTRSNGGETACKLADEADTVSFLGRTGTSTTKEELGPSARAGTLSFLGHTGTNQVAFQGRLIVVGEPEQLPPGRYNLVVTATDSGDVSAAPKSLSFTIVK